MDGPENNSEVIVIDSDDDDLEVTSYVKNSASGKIKSSPAFKAENLDTPSRITVNAPVNIETDGSDIDDGFSDGEAAYLKFKDRKSVKRRQSAAATRRAKIPKIPKREQPPDDMIVGLVKPEKMKSRPKRPLKQYGEVSSEEELMEHTLPAYVQQRRQQFDRRQDHLKEYGLKLPPSYDDVEFSDDERLQDLHEKPSFPDRKPVREYKDITLPYSLGLIPAPIAQWLRQYQVEGVEFMHEKFIYQKGGILGDDMGLGKTIQVIAFLTAAYGKTADERDWKRMRKIRRSDSAWYPRTLIICPGTLLANWTAELKRWGWWHIEQYHGPSKDLALDAAKSGRVEILITTYTTYVHNKELVNLIEWDCVIADECHKIKERKSQTTQSMNEINALCRIGLTGTAIQNRYEELWTLLNWTNPGVLGPVTTWKAQIAEPLKIGQSHNATVNELSKARRTAKKLVENLLPQFFLRRMKTLIADQLPKKSDRVVFCPLTWSQAEAYENFLDSDIVESIKNSTDPCHCGSGKKQGWCCHKFVPGFEHTPWQAYVFPAITVLQKLSNHLAILIPQGNDPRERQEKDKEMLQIAVPDGWEDLYRSRDSITNFANPEFCGKWKVLRKLLKWWHSNGDKVLVFSHSVRLLRMLQTLFNHTSYNVSYLDGSMKYEDRAQAVDDFNSDPKQFVFLISTKAGGVGLNITSANKVVVVDPNWNPSYDLQAQDRAYRIGQVRDVEVFRLVSAGTIEEIVYARQIYKQQQAEIGYNASSERRYFKGVQDQKNQKGEIFGLQNLFSYQFDNVVLRDIVNKTNVAESRAGVQVVDFHCEEDENASGTDGGPVKSEDEAMSQYAAMIRGETDTKDGPKHKSTSTPTTTPTPHKHDPVQAILSSAGVEYTHLNNEVIGSSRVEAQLSRRAEQVNNDPKANNQVFEPSSYPHDEDGDPFEEIDPTSMPRDTGSRTSRFKYNPPEAVKRRQFCSMARSLGYQDATEFALVVEGMTQAQRRACLDRWYEERRNALLGKGDEIKPEELKREVKFEGLKQEVKKE
ncbi:DNA excision repair protein ERCC-6-like 2 [Penicillium angulare]|uniref:DNA excision repair protein ERCC-6-like 2 n=1 Tax=Penicillium angulare TaxID=116970 RepID=UPI00254093F1|nr:DNA excision repair protein ERCC-6-like 2 [Penicillium angulare]KAJ5266651.1 DNA excision repair protein ERCC-6-like 2 [Penicillium angulare]